MCILNFLYKNKNLEYIIKLIVAIHKPGIIYKYKKKRGNDTEKTTEK